MYQVFIQLRIKENTEFGEFNDAIYFTEEEYNNVKPETLDAMVKTRVDNWVNIIKNPPPPVEPTIDELISVKQQLQMQQNEIESKIAEKGGEDAVKQDEVLGGPFDQVLGGPINEILQGPVNEPVKEVVGEPVKEVVGEPVKEVVGEPVKEVVGEPVKEVLGGASIDPL